MKATDVIRELRKISTPEKAKASAWFFKTGKGQYGEGDKFIGVTVPEQRKIAKAHRDLSLEEIKKLLESPIHEHRLTALIILIGQYEKGNDAIKKAVASFYLANLDRVNNWDLVDSSAPYIFGDWLLVRDRKLLHVLARSKDIWKRRIAIVSTLAFIKNGETKDVIDIAKILMTDTHDLIHKATGWMLREMGKRASRKELVKFLDQNATRMPRTMLRYAIEHFSPAERKRYLVSK